MLVAEKEHGMERKRGNLFVAESTGRKILRTLFPRDVNITDVKNIHAMVRKKEGQHTAKLMA